ncbi:MAG: hypothetical protein AB7R89_19385 [Dehalococcoidia bacterium]
MVTESATNYYATATNLYLGWVDASLHTNERLARVARVWIDETLGAQQEIASLIKRAVDEAQSSATAEEATPTPFTFITRAGDATRAGYQLWTETGLKTQEHAARVFQTAFEEFRGAQTEIAQRAEEGIGELRGQKNGKKA